MINSVYHRKNREYIDKMIIYIDNITISGYSNTGDAMRGIDLNKPITYKHASLRFFEKEERHVDRVCEDDVLLLVYEGMLRFLENGREYRVEAGHYHIQQQGSVQRGHVPSDSPRYLYVHFQGEWADHPETLAYSGEFDPVLMQELLDRMDRIAHENRTHTEKTALFFRILSMLYRNQRPENKGHDMARYLERHFAEKITLEALSGEFHYGKNQIINIFKKSYSQTPMEYLNRVRMQNALRLLEVTSNTAESIAETCGFRNYSHFYRLFVRSNGMSPTQWRQKRRLSVL